MIPVSNADVQNTDLIQKKEPSKSEEVAIYEVSTSADQINNDNVDKNVDNNKVEEIVPRSVPESVPETVSVPVPETVPRTVQGPTPETVSELTLDKIPDTVQAKETPTSHQAGSKDTLLTSTVPLQEIESKELTFPYQ